jgi:hypothetical protein
VLRGEEWRRHPGHGHPARLGSTEPSAVVSPGFLWGGQAWRRLSCSGLQRKEGSSRAAHRGGLGGEARGMTTPATCKPDCLRWGPPPLAKQEWGVEVDRGGGGGEIRRPDGARPRRRRPAQELAAARWRTASTRGRQPGWRRWRAERGRAWARRRGRPEGGAGGRPGLTQLRRRAGELRAPTPGSYSRATPRLGARSGPAGLTPAPMGVRRALAPPRDRPRNSSHAGNAGRGPWARGLPVGGGSGVPGGKDGGGLCAPTGPLNPGCLSLKIEVPCHVSGVPCACATWARGANQRAWHPRPQW